jgi:hypothetical protein
MRRSFHAEVVWAYKEAVVPLLPFGVTAPIEITVDQTKVVTVVVDVENEVGGISTLSPTTSS